MDRVPSQLLRLIGSGPFRGIRGGGFYDRPSLLAASYRGLGTPANEGIYVGFRVASYVAAPVPALSPLGLLVVAAGLLGFVGYRRGRA